MSSFKLDPSAFKALLGTPLENEIKVIRLTVALFHRNFVITFTIVCCERPGLPVFFGWCKTLFAENPIVKCLDFRKLS